MAPERRRFRLHGEHPAEHEQRHPQEDEITSHRVEPRRLDQAVLGEEPVFSAVEVADEAGVSVEETRRLWRALGFPEIVGEAAFTQSDVDAVAAVLGIVDSGAVAFDMAVTLTRAVGQTMARLADWEVATLAHRVEELEAGEEATGSRAGSALRLIRDVNPPFEDLLVYAWRRHLAAAVARMEAMGANHADLHTTDVTVGFADLVAFTALSNEIDRADIGDLVELFEGRCHDVISRYGGRIIKSLGDSVLFVLDDAEDAVEVAEGIITVIGRDPKMPDVRVGLASGAVVMRLGDVFGPPVNLAARLTAVARRNRLIVDQATADELPVESFESRRLPARPVRGFGLVEPVTLRRR
jgi:adenylate cyclase